MPLSVSLPTRDALRRWPALLEVALVLLLALQAAHLLWALATPVGPLAQAGTGTLPARLPVLAGLDPFFGGVIAGPARTSAGLDGWQLFGVRVAGEGSSAILAKDKSSQSAYRPGDELAPGVVLERVEADHVTIRDGGIPRRLELPIADIPAGSAAPAVSRLPSALPATATAAVPVSVDPGQLLAQSGLKAVDEGGRVAGYTLMPQGDDSLVRAAGLKPGDVLLRVNGQPLAPGTFAESAAELQRDPRATIEFQRDGQPQSVTLGNQTP